MKCALIMVLAALALAPSASAQTFTRRRVPQGEVTGLEMGIEGTLAAVPGGRLRWYLTLYEVVRRTDLRVAPGCAIRATLSVGRAEPLAEVTTDAAGRAMLELPISEELVSGPHLMLEAVSPRGIRRVFDVDLRIEPRFVVELLVDRDQAPPGAGVVAFGRVLDRARGLAVSDHEVVVRASAGGPLGAPVTLMTDGAGVFSTPLVLATPRAGDVRVSARIEGYEAVVTVQVRELERRPLHVAARPEHAVVTPGTDVNVEVLVRTAEGVPIEGARIAWRDQSHLPNEERSLARTDAEGRASLRHAAPRWIDAPYADHAWTLEAAHPGYGSREHSVAVRVARQRAFLTWAVEGGALVPELEGRVLVRVVGPNGAPLADREVALSAARLGDRRTARTDSNGVAILAGTVGPPVPGERCGGPTAAAAELTVEGHRESVCLPVDPDATLVLEAHAGASRRVHVELSRRAIVARAPVSLSALVRRGQDWAPVAEVTSGAGASALELELPPEVTGEVWLRARPLVDARHVRGGGALAWVGPAPSRLELRADASGARVESGSESATLAVFALAPERARSLIDAARSSLGPVGTALDAGASEASVRLLLASRTPHDEAVSAVLREGRIETLPLPAEPTREGLLRDPWRTRARFVRGRIGRLMGAVERYVAERVPGSIDDVATREGGRHAFNADLLEGALPSAGLGGEGAATLDGEPLDIAGLRAMDAAFSYDNVARRITRQRLWFLLRALRTLVRERELDLGWARRGDPTHYLVSMLEADDVSFEEGTPSREQLFDAWSTPFALRPVRARARFSFLEPVPGFELVSAGPDRRFGTGDDMVDPFARVLPSGSLYAEAVGEDALIARLSGVALGRATAESLGALFEIAEPELEGDEGLTATSSTLPSLLVPGELGPVPLAAPHDVLGGVGPLERAWTLPAERGRYSVVALRFSSSAPISSARAELVAGAPYAVQLELPRVMRPGEALEVPVSVVRLGAASAPAVEVRSRGSALDASMEGARLRLVARRAGVARVTVRLSSEGELVWSRETEVRVVPPGRLRARHASALVEGRGELSADAPSGAVPWRASLVLGAPGSIDRDPMLAAAREAHPAPFAWAMALRGEDVDPALLARIERAAGTDGRGLGAGLDAACALSALAASDDRRILAAATRTLSEGLGDELADRASVLAALAPSAPGAPGPSGDPLGALAVRLREDGWRALASTSDRPAVMARMAAALLLVDRRDAPGLALLARARASLERDAFGRAWVPGDPARAGDGWIGTLALAVAARQAGEDELAGELARSAATRLYLASRTGVDGAFWALAASTYGAFGVDGPERVTVVVNGRESELELANGRAELAVPASSRVEVRGTALARIESRFVGELGASDAGPLTTHIEGDPGRLGDRSGLELVVEGRLDGVEVGVPVVEIVLPGAAALDAAALAALRRSEAVARVQPPDGAGVLRIELAPLRAGATHRVPLPWRWIAAGTTRGLEVASYDASRPWALGSSAGRTLTVEAR